MWIRQRKRKSPACAATCAVCGGDFTDLIPADGGKAVGMQVVLEHFGWSRDNAIAFGDGGNDVDMLRFAGIGVAMGNATDEPKTVADYVTDSVDDAGISNALHHFEIL